MKEFNIRMSFNQLFNTDDKYNKAHELLRTMFKRRPKRLLPFKLHADGNIVTIAEPHLMVVPKHETQALLNHLWRETDDIKHMLSKGVKSLYEWLALRYINISTADVKRFLDSNASYQLTSQPNKSVNKPTIETEPNKRWQADLIDMSREGATRNRGFRYILTVVDVFSRMTWLRALKQKTADAVRDAFRDVVESSGAKPKTLQTDNGGEFKDSFHDYVRSIGAYQHYNDSHTPNQNAIVERKNQEVRRVIRASMLERQITKDWWVVLPIVEQHLNERWTENINNNPSAVWSADATMSQTEAVTSATKRINKRNKQMMDTYKVQDSFKLGDEVRLKMELIFSNMRRLLKKGDSKHIVVSYTPIAFVVTRVLRPRGKLERKKYLLANKESKQVVMTHDGKSKWFYASNMVLTKGTNADISMEQALELNGVETSNTDLFYE